MNEQEIRRAEREHVLRAVGHWLETKNRHKPNQPTTREDMEHSSLLKRLLEGKARLESPPPRRFGNPDYALAQGEKTQPQDVSAWRGNVFEAEQIDMSALVSGDQVQIDLGYWDVEEVHPGKVLLRWPDAPKVLYALRKESGEWVLQRHST